MALQRDAITPREWKFPSEIEIDESIVEAADNSEILAKLLIRRGLHTPAEIAAFLDPALFKPSSPSELPDTARAVARILQAIESKEKITVYGDYDVDGVTATAVMLTTLRRLGAEADFYIPNRSEGYGLNLKAISVLASKHRTKLIISCDCGISNFSEINFARSLSVDTIVVDHHTMPELLPPAAAILHPKQLPEDHALFHLPGVGVAYKLCEALLIEKGQPEEVEKLLDFVTLGMIADMVPLTKECRYLVQIGMPKLVGSPRPGIQALLAQVTNKSEGTDLVGFGLAPRINAVGRLSDAMLAVNLMITDDPQEASQLAKQLELENARRQELCEQIFMQADLRVTQLMQPGDKAIAVYDVGWHHGVVGIVASRLVEKYHCPVFVGELDEKEGIVKGSARGIAGIDLYEVLKANEHLALKWGGHKMAAGWSVEAAKAELFCRGLVDTCTRLLAEQTLRGVVEVDLEVDAQAVTTDLAAVISRLAPFGMANKKPIIVMRKQECVGTRALGKEGKHTRINLMSDDAQFECVFWNSKGRVPDEGQVMDVAFTPEINVYKGNSRLQLVLSDWRDPSRPFVPQPVVTPVVSSPTLSFAPATSAGQPVQSLSSQGGIQDTTPSTSLPRAGDVIDARPTGAPPSGKENSAPASSPAGSAMTPASQHSRANLTQAAAQLIWKDLRSHAAPDSLVQAAVRKLGASVAIFGESCHSPDGAQIFDRSTIDTAQHLLLWSYPPEHAVFQQLIQRTGACNIYLIGGIKPAGDEPAAFLKRLLGLVRFAVNQREGQADAEKVAAALGATWMTVALGLTILKKINIIDWFAEDGLVNVDLIGQPVGKAEEVGEFRQLANCLNEIIAFRRWCNESPLKELQLQLVPAKDSVQDAGQAEITDLRTQQQSSGIIST